MAAMVLVKKSSLGKRRGKGNGRAPKRRVVGGGLPKNLQGVARIGGFYGRFANGGELKFFDVPLTDAVVATAGTITDSINKIAQGVTEVTRVGRKCTIRSIGFRYKITLSEVDAVATPGPGDSVRIMVYLDKQCNGATAAVLDILETANYLSFRNLANSGRFVILHDVTKDLNFLTLASDNAAVVSSADVSRNYTFYKKCGIPIEFNATTGAITEIRSNNFGLLVISSSGACALDMNFRLRFSDG